MKIFFERTNPKTGQVEQLEKDGKSMIGVLSLGIERDNPFTLVLDGEDEEIYISKFEELLNSYEWFTFRNITAFS